MPTCRNIVEAARPRVASNTQRESESGNNLWGENVGLMPSVKILLCRLEATLCASSKPSGGENMQRTAEVFLCKKRAKRTKMTSPGQPSKGRVRVCGSAIPRGPRGRGEGSRRGPS